MPLSKQTWVVQWLDRSVEVHEEHANEEDANQRAGLLRGKLIKIYRRDVWTPETPPTG